MGERLCARASSILMLALALVFGAAEAARLGDEDQAAARQRIDVEAIGDEMLHGEDGSGLLFEQEDDEEPSASSQALPPEAARQKSVQLLETDVAEPAEDNELEVNAQHVQPQQQPAQAVQVEQQYPDAVPYNTDGTAASQATPVAASATGAQAAAAPQQQQTESSQSQIMARLAAGAGRVATTPCRVAAPAGAAVAVVTAPVVAAAPAEPHDCTAGLIGREYGWSLLKKEWCCKTKDIGCKDYYRHRRTLHAQHPYDWPYDYYDYSEPDLEVVHVQGPADKVVHVRDHADGYREFDCAEGLENWERTWSVAKKGWCCFNMNVACVGEHRLEAVRKVIVHH